VEWTAAHRYAAVVAVVRLTVCSEVIALCLFTMSNSPTSLVLPARGIRKLGPKLGVQDFCFVQQLRCHFPPMD
jgi:hypothetical protein